jgi:hypothetical protein
MGSYSIFKAFRRFTKGKPAECFIRGVVNS